MRRVPRLGRSRALRQHARGDRGDPRARRARASTTRSCPASAASRRWRRATASRSTASARPIVITTGRRLAEGLHDDADDIVVMLDAACAFRRFAGDADRHLLGRLHRHAGRDPGRGRRRRRDGRDRARARRSARAQGLDHGHYLLRRRLEPG